MSVIEELKITTYINAHDTYTVYGGSRMTARTLKDMRDIAAVFVDMDDLQLRLGKAAAQLTHNEDAFFTNGSAGALTTAAAVCICRDDPFVFSRLPTVAESTPSEIIQLHCQHNAYDKAVEAAGAKILEIGDADETLAYALEGSITQRTAGVFYYASCLYSRGSLPLERVVEIAHRHGIPLVVDSTFATPYLIRPIEYGADIVVHSATKFIGGHGTAIGGVIVDSGNFDWKASGKYPWISQPNPSYHGVSFADAAGPAAFVTYIRAILLRDTGATLSPFHAFLFLQGLETLSLRLERHVENALNIVEYLNRHPLVEAVHHPSLPSEPSHQLYQKYFPHGAGSIFTFEIKGDAQTAQTFIDNLAIFSLLANVADVKSLVIHPASTTHSQLTPEELLDQGIRPNTIRLSIGTENVKDLIAALEDAFAAVQSR